MTIRSCSIPLYVMTPAPMLCTGNHYHKGWCCIIAIAKPSALATHVTATKATISSSGNKSAKVMHSILYV